MKTLFLTSAILLLGGFLGLSAASAQDTNAQVAEITGNLPLEQASRPLTLTANTLRLDGEFRLTRASATATGLRIGAGYGVTEDLEIGVSPFNAQLSEDFNYGADLYGAFRILKGDFELAARVGVTISNLDPFAVGIRPSVPLRLHLSDSMRLDFDPGLNIAITDGESAFGFGSPIGFTVNLTPNIWLQPRTGFYINNFDAAGDSITLPLGVQAGYTLANASNGPMLDLYAGFDVPFFINTFGGDTVSFDVWTISAGANFYLDM